MWKRARIKTVLGSFRSRIAAEKNENQLEVLMKNNRLKKNSKNQKNRCPVQVALPGFPEIDQETKEPKFSCYPFPFSASPRVDLVINPLFRPTCKLMLEKIGKRYLEAEIILNIKTAHGVKIRESNPRDHLAIIEIFSFLRDWFKFEFKEDLHPLFPFVLEEMGYETDEERITDMWKDFFKEKLRFIFKQSPELIFLLTQESFPVDEVPLVQAEVLTRKILEQLMLKILKD